jgi:hypothetical protein
MANLPMKAERMNLRLAAEDRTMLAALATDDGMNESAVLRLLVRREYRARGLGQTTLAPKPAKSTKGVRR